MDTVSEKLLKLHKEKLAEVQLYRDLFMDRNQLYGSIITLMNKLDMKSIVVTKQDFLDSSKFMAEFKPAEDGSLTLSLSDYIPEETKDES